MNAKLMPVLLAILIATFAVVGCSSSSSTGTSPSPRFAFQSDDVLIGRAKDIVNAVVDGRWEAARTDFDATMKANLTAQRLEASWLAFKAIKGSFVSLGTGTVVFVPDHAVVNLLIHMSKGDAQARVTFDTDTKVGGLFFLEPGTPVPGAAP